LPPRYVIISAALEHLLCNKYSLYIFGLNVNYIIVTLPLILFSDYVCNVDVMGEALLDGMIKIQITELVE
jgi:membrane associated rhomboid family serine protease